MTAPTVDVPCTHPKCSVVSVWSQHGMVAGRYWPLCHKHAVAYLQERLDRLVVEAEALAALPKTGQLTLVES